MVRLSIDKEESFSCSDIEIKRSGNTYTYETLQELKEIYPDSVPFTMKSGIDGFFRLGIGWGIKCFQPYYDEENKIWAYSDTSDECKDMLDFIKKLYNEELFEKEFATITQSAWTAKMTAPDKTFVT
jgi:putative aldouronate transport system substrate-binding protein